MHALVCRGNTLADGVATTAVRENTPAWQVDLTQQDELNVIASCAGTPLEMDVRQFLKQQTTIRHHQALLAQKTVKRAVPDFEAVEWRSTLSIIHDRRPVHTFFSSQSDTRNRSRRIKKLFGMLPTMNVMRARHPNLYEDTNCRVCEVNPEDNDHIWCCPETAEVQAAFWEEGLQSIDAWGKQAIAETNRQALERYNRDLAARRVNTPPPVPKTWRGATEDAIWTSLSFINGASDLRNSRITMEANNHLGWSIPSLYRGLSPLQLSTKWKRLFRVPASVATTIAHRFVSYLEEQATELIWKSRCTTTVEWEERRGILPANKRETYRGPRMPWSTGFDCPADRCKCGRPITDHEANQCPGAFKDPLAADEQLLASLAGRRHPTIMERMGRIPFL